MINITTTLMLLRFALLLASRTFFKLGELAFAAARLSMLDASEQSRQIRRIG
jgi:hypothetical protein